MVCLRSFVPRFPYPHPPSKSHKSNKTREKEYVRHTPLPQEAHICDCNSSTYVCTSRHNLSSHNGFPLDLGGKIFARINTHKSDPVLDCHALLLSLLCARSRNSTAFEIAATKVCERVPWKSRHSR